MRRETTCTKSISEIVRIEMTKNGSADNRAHDLGHIDRVMENWKWLIFNSGSISMPMAKMLQAAGYFHDVKLGDEGEYEDHAKASAAFFLSQNIDGFTQEQTEYIAFAIANHNVGLEKMGLEADSDRNILLQLLVIIDGMDTICHVGYYRQLEWYGQQGKPFSLFGKHSADRLQAMLDGGFTNRELDVLKNKGCVVTDLIYNLKLFRRSLEPVRHLLGVDFLIEVEKRMSILREEIEKMIKMKRRKERPMAAFP